MNDKEEKTLLGVARNEVLLQTDPLTGVDMEVIPVQYVCDVLQTACQYIESGLDLEDNPLPALRRYFPKFIWKYHNPETAVQAAQIISRSDYSLPIGMSGHDWSLGFYTATFAHGALKRICFCPTDGSGEPDLHFWRFDIMRRHGIMVLVNDPLATCLVGMAAFIKHPHEMGVLQDQQYIRNVERSKKG